MTLRSVRALLCWVALLFSTLTAHAQAPTASGEPPGPTLAPALLLDAVPLLGPGSPAGERWLTTVVRIVNNTDQQIEGHVELTSELAWSRAEQRLRTRAPFAIAGKARVTLQLPTHGFMGTPPQLRLKAFDTKGAVLGFVDLPDPRPLEPTLLDLTLPTRIGPGVRGMHIAAQHTSSLRSGYGSSSPTLGVSSPQVNGATGEPILPDRSAGYASATLVLCKSDQLAALQGSELDALTHWVIGGGSLAVAISRPEDLRSPSLAAMVGAVIQATAAPARLGAEAEFVVPMDSGGSYGYAPRNILKRAAPSDDVKAKLVGYSGGNLHPSPWGATASYGLGELTLLGFDATRDPAASDEWARFKIAELVRHAWDRQVSIALPHAATALDTGAVDGIRKQLDPNEGARWAIVVALLLLIVYAMLAGPLNFYLASKKGRPLRALWHLPIWSGATMASIVVLGAFAKGVTGRARHLSLIEVGAGMTRGSITRFRGFYASAAEQLLVRASDRGNVLDVAGDDASETSRELVVDRDGARLEKFQAKPWQTLIVREDGFTSLGGGVSLVERGTDVEVKNRTARDLIGVLVWRPVEGVSYFPRIKDGESVLASAGRPLPKKIGRRRFLGTLNLRDLDAIEFAPTIESDVKGAGEAWKALDELIDNNVNWWPDDAPILIGQLEGGEGKTRDSGLAMDMDRVLIRVVGVGGVP
ncbi:MAG: hypothetical protein IPI67_15045 [Myxococcales bacterium]|nr:hypothetical protein [Myxococcales bacterium]